MKHICTFVSCILVLAASFASCGKISNSDKEVLITDLRFTCGGETFEDYHVTRVDSISWIKVEVEPAGATEKLIWEFDRPDVV